MPSPADQVRRFRATSFITSRHYGKADLSDFTDN